MVVSLPEDGYILIISRERNDAKIYKQNNHEKINYNTIRNRLLSIND